MVAGNLVVGFEIDIGGTFGFLGSCDSLRISLHPCTVLGEDGLLRYMGRTRLWCGPQ